MLDEARTWLRTPYHPGADIKGVGVDCAMILVRLYAGIGRVPANLDPRPYPPDWHLHRSEEKYIGWLTQYATEVTTPKPGDVGVWLFGRAFSHGGVLLDEAGTILHAYKGAGVITTPIKGHPLAGREVRWFDVVG